MRSVWAKQKKGKRRRGGGGHQAAGLKAYRPTTPGLRGRVITARGDLHKGRPFPALTQGLVKKTGGRNEHGRITVWHRGGGARRRLRLVDLRRGLLAAQGVVQRLEYDPNRSANIALVRYDGEGVGEGSGRGGGAGEGRGGGRGRYPFVRQGHGYILAAEGLEAGSLVQAGPAAPIKPGNAMALKDIPVGLQLHNVELHPGRGGQLARSAGTGVTLLKKDDGRGYALLRLPSGEQRLVLNRCTATIGVVGNAYHKNQKLGKAGARRWKGRRPIVRGVAMNPIDHPHGGGEGKTSGGRPSVTPWGKPTKGKKTRNSPRTDRFIQLSRHKAKNKK